MFIFRILLYPLAIIYNLITRFRNRLYDLGIKPSAHFDIPLINVGNITVGGTGKTPMVEYLIRLITEEYKAATLSRGYGRKSRGFRIANKEDTAATIGDEPFQIYNKFSGKVIVSVGEERALAIPNLMDEHPEIQAIVLDDAFQHRKVKPSLNILLTDYNRLFFKDYLLPSGRLRESREGAKRADVIVVTKCPMTINGEEMIVIQKSVSNYVSRPIFFTSIRYGSPVSFGRKDAELKDNVVLVTGIANTLTLEKYIAKSFKIVEHLKFNDHHVYKRNDIQHIAMKCQSGSIVITTEKDMVKMIGSEFMDVIRSLPIFYLPIQTIFIKDGEDFDAIVLNHILERSSKNVDNED